MTPVGWIALGVVAVVIIVVVIALTWREAVNDDYPHQHGDGE